jgi:hypothetical protein
MQPDQISLPEASRRLRQPWHRTYRDVLAGELTAEQGQNGRWAIDAASVDRLARERQMQTPQGTDLGKA